MNKYLILLFVAISINAKAQKFPVVVPSGQTIYFRILYGTAGTTYPSDNDYYPYNGYTKPTGAITIPDSIEHDGVTYPVTRIGSNSFDECSNITSILLPNTITEIGTTSFSKTGIDTMIVPNSVQQIGLGAFYHCPNLTYVCIPPSVQSMGNGVFQDCSSLSTVLFNARNCTFSTYSASTYRGVTFRKAFDTCINLTTVIFGDSVETIPYAIFYECSSLTNVTIPSTVNSIGMYAFLGCESLTSIILPDSITTIPDGLFYNCSTLTNVIIPNAVSSIGNSAFRNCTSLHNIDLPNNLIIIGNSAFEGCTLLDSVVIPVMVDSIGESAFASCTGLHDIFLEPTTPPSIFMTSDYSQFHRQPFYNIYGLRRHIPCGTTTIYQNNWPYGTFYEPVVDFDFIVYTNDTTIGSAAITREIVCADSSLVIQATVIDTHYHFSSWSNGNTANPDTLYLVGDSAVTAIFERNQYIVTTYSNDSSMGYVEGGDTYLYQDTVQLIAVPMEYFHFVQWSDGNIDNPRQWVVVTDTQFTAFFEADTFQLNVISNNNMQGNVSGSGTFPYGIPVTISATANTGYHFTHWSNRNTNNPDTLYLISDSTITAFFERNQYTLTVQSNNTSFGEVEGGGSYLYQDTALLIATANDTYHFVRWNDGNTDNPRQYIVTGNATLTATFAIDTFHVNVASNNIVYGGVSGEGDYQYGTPATVTATAYTGYHFSQWSNGITANPYTFAVLQDTELTAIFVEDGTQGIDNIESSDVHVYLHNGKIVVSGVDKESIYLYDIYGRLLTTKQAEYSQSLLDIPSSGIYLVKVGNHPAKKIVVIK